MVEATPPAVNVVPWARRELPGRFTVEETAVRVGHYKWLEMRLFELLGGWVAFVPELEIKHRLGVHCHHHAFHVELWHKRLQELVNVDPERLTVAPGPEIEQLMGALGDPTASGDTIEKLVGVYRVVLPAVIAAYSYHLNHAAEITDGPTMRALSLCLDDDRDEWREGEMMLQWLIASPDDVDRAMARQAELSKLLVAAGGVVGAGSLGPAAEGSVGDPSTAAGR